MGANTRDLAANKKLSGLIVPIDLGDYGAAAAPAMFAPTSGYGGRTLRTYRRCCQRRRSIRFKQG